MELGNRHWAVLRSLQSPETFDADGWKLEARFHSRLSVNPRTESRSDIKLETLTIPLHSSLMCTHVVRSSCHFRVRTASSKLQSLGSETLHIFCATVSAGGNLISLRRPHEDDHIAEARGQVLICSHYGYS